MIDLELEAVARVGLPEPSDFDFFAFRNREDMVEMLPALAAGEAVATDNFQLPS